MYCPGSVRTMSPEVITQEVVVHGIIKRDTKPEPFHVLRPLHPLMFGVEGDRPPLMFSTVA